MSGSKPDETRRLTEKGVDMDKLGSLKSTTWAIKGLMQKQ